MTGLIDWPSVTTGMEDATIMGKTPLYAASRMQEVMALLLLLVLLLLLSAAVAAGPGCVFRVSSACLPRVICVTGLIDWASVSPTVSTGMEDATILGNTTLSPCKR